MLNIKLLEKNSFIDKNWKLSCKIYYFRVEYFCINFYIDSFGE